MIGIGFGAARTFLAATGRRNGLGSRSIKIFIGGKYFVKEMSFAELFSFCLSFFDSYFIRWQQVLRTFLMASLL